ncbi:hypothetical protein TCE0_015r02939 [Talaromyces pinophilus]|uniref:Amidase domain-containing protein n=1 Tax=Talaromyces pinophilus TaxID=128442 RepID=A0A6V8H1Y1_TALPI|nr:hypothetical protein TCE0_015r02939 [Talaromyces pinophilus]
MWFTKDGRQVLHFLKSFWIFNPLCHASTMGATESAVLPSLLNITLDEIAIGLDRNQFTSEDLVRSYIARIDEVNHKLNAVVEINPDAFAIARQLDNERLISGKRSVLHGVPILLKDNIFTSDKMQTTAGSLCLLGAKPEREATIVELLRRAGAVLLGKTNLSEWANFRSAGDNATDGWSARGGQTYAPYLERQNPCGSSSGSAVAAAVGLAAATIGTETDGSIICPSGKSAVVGIKPTVGLTSRDGVIPGSPRQDTVGPIARTVKDAAMILNAIAGKSPFDSATDRIPYWPIPDFTAKCNPFALRKIRIGIPRNAMKKGTQDVDTVFQSAITALKEAGAIVVDDINFSDLEKFKGLNTDLVLLRDFKDSLDTFLQNLPVNPHSVRSLEDVIEFTKLNAGEFFPDRDIGTFEQAISSPHKASDVYQDMLHKSIYYAQNGLKNTLEHASLDAVALPASAIHATSMAAVLGYPIVTVPMGYYPKDAEIHYNNRGDLVTAGPGFPIGLQIIGRPFDEQNLIGYAYAFEQQTKIRQKQQPLIQPNTELEDTLAKRMGVLVKSEL